MTILVIALSILSVVLSGLLYSTVILLRQERDSMDRLRARSKLYLADRGLLTLLLRDIRTKTTDGYCGDGPGAGELWWTLDRVPRVAKIERVTFRAGEQRWAVTLLGGAGQTEWGPEDFANARRMKTSDCEVDSVPSMRGVALQ